MTTDSRMSSIYRPIRVLKTVSGEYVLMSDVEKISHTLPSSEEGVFTKLKIAGVFDTTNEYLFYLTMKDGNIDVINTSEKYYNDYVTASEIYHVTYDAGPGRMYPPSCVEQSLIEGWLKYSKRLDSNSQ